MDFTHKYKSIFLCLFSKCVYLCILVQDLQNKYQHRLDIKFIPKIVSKFYILTLYQNSFLAILAFRYGHTQRKFTLITTLNPKLIIKKLYKKEETN